jgi:hypothetical protein
VDFFFIDVPSGRRLLLSGPISESGQRNRKAYKICMLSKLSPELEIRGIV